MGWLRVARLAGRGRTNRQIAENLYVTQRNVETHLRPTFKKFDIAKRGSSPKT